MLTSDELFEMAERQRKNKIRQIVAGWLVQLWIDRPEWLVRMPDRKEVDDLIDRITEGTKR